jgi:hypothetical protein
MNELAMEPAIVVDDSTQQAFQIFRPCTDCSGTGARVSRPCVPTEEGMADSLTAQVQDVIQVACEPSLDTG